MTIIRLLLQQTQDLLDMAWDSGMPEEQRDYITRAQRKIASVQTELALQAELFQEEKREPPKELPQD